MRRNSPRAVNIPSAAIIPRKSSEKFLAEQENWSFFSRFYSARSAFIQILPDAAPGPAGSPLQSFFAPFSEQLNQKLEKVLDRVVQQEPS